MESDLVQLPLQLWAAWCAPCAAFSKQKVAHCGLTPASEGLISFLSGVHLEKPPPNPTLLKLIGISAKCTTLYFYY